jgi:hypothetical protein
VYVVQTIGDPAGGPPELDTRSLCWGIVAGIIGGLLFAEFVLPHTPLLRRKVRK